MLRGNSTLPLSAQLSLKAVYELICTTEGFTGRYGAVKHYVCTMAPDDASSIIGVSQGPDQRARTRQAAFEWMRAVLQKEISQMPCTVTLAMFLTF
jgi:hypothetical protein